MRFFLSEVILLFNLIVVNENNVVCMLILFFDGLICFEYYEECIRLINREGFFK